MKRDLASRARTARIRAGFPKESDAAKAIGCSRPLVIRWENGDAKRIGGKYLTSAARAYRVRPEWLAMESDDDGFPWSENASGATVDRVVLTRALVAARRELDNADMPVTDEEEAAVVALLYEMMREDPNLSSVAHVVRGMLNAFSVASVKKT